MGKRKTAKTGDKALYNSREQLANQSGSKKKSDDDPMYDEVDRFHNEKDLDFIRLGEEEGQNSDDEDADLAGNTHSVLDLGAGGSSSEEDDDDDDDDDSSSDEGDKFVDKKAENYSSSDDSVSSDDDDDDDMDMIKEDPRNWGKKKSLYYHGDTADLEIGQEEDDAFLEEEAAQEIQKSRFEEMDEDDFMLSEDEEGSSSKKNDAEAGDSSKPRHEELQTIRDTSKLSKKETRKLMDKQYPELLPMTSYFSDIVKDLKDRTEIATNALMESEETAESVGATIKGQQYLVAKAMIQKSIALNSVMYILLRSASAGDEDATSNIQAHPVMDHLKKLTTLLENLEGSVQKKAKDIDMQLDNLVKAAALMGNAGGDDDDDDDAGSSDGDDKSSSSMKANDEQVEDSSVVADGSLEDSSEDTDAETREAIAQKKQKDFERTLNEARFGLRPNEVKNSSTVSRKRRPHNLDDFGDLEEDEEKFSGNVLASTINTIEQRSKTASRKRRPAPVAEQLDDLEEYDDRLAQGLKMMEEEMGKLDDDGDDDGKNDDMDMGENDMADPDADDDALGFYNQIANKSKKKKSFKKSLYKVAPKYPRVDGEVAGERSIDRTILKNRGLVAHKAKINRNPRVKKREQYRKALIRRKGAVREVRDAAEGNKYGGEQTGIKSRISRSRKL